MDVVGVGWIRFEFASKDTAVYDTPLHLAILQISYKFSDWRKLLLLPRSQSSSCSRRRGGRFLRRSRFLSTCSHTSDLAHDTSFRGRSFLGHNSCTVAGFRRVTTIARARLLGFRNRRSAASSTHSAGIGSVIRLASLLTRSAPSGLRTRSCCACCRDGQRCH